MRRHLLFLFIVIATCAKSQVVFFPPGAVWHYNFKYVRNGPEAETVYTNIPIAYSNDTILDGENVKILKHTHFFKGACLSYVTHTFIKQHADTIFMNNIYTDGWQILYNFATPVNGQWQTTIKNPFSPFNLITTTVTVNSVQTIIVNGMSLKQLITSVGVITERIGGSFLFYFNTMNCDDEMFSNLLCYQDNGLGTYHASDKICEYASYYVGIDEQENQSGISLYPNPVSDKLSIELLRQVQKPELRITDILGKEVLTIKPLFTNSKTELDLSTLNTGIYFLKVFDNGKLIISKKIIKE